MVLETSNLAARCCTACRFLLFVFILGGVVGAIQIRESLQQLFESARTGLDEEALIFAEHLQLAPGMTLCEMGSGNGALLSRLTAHVMPGGRLVATSIHQSDLDATAAAIAAAGYDAAVLRTYLATDDAWAPGLPDGTCDAFYSRMVIHAIPERVVVDTYIGQWARSVKRGGLMFMADHNPTDCRAWQVEGMHTGVATTVAATECRGPKRPMMKLLGVIPMMPVVPSLTEVTQIIDGGFELVSGPFAHDYFQMGYGAVYTPALR